MNLDELSSPRDYREKYNTAVRRIQKLERAHASLLGLNDIFKQELEQKQNALQQSAAEYAKLKKEYEEILARLTEVCIENQNRPPPSPDPVLVDSLREQIQKLSVRKSGFKNQAVRLRQRVEQLESEVASLRHENSEWMSTYSVCLNLISAGRAGSSPPSVVADVIRQLSEANREMVTRERYARLESKYRNALETCEALAAKVRENGEILREGLIARRARNGYSAVNHEMAKMQRYLSRYEAECENL
jgi:DNA repair exonuclease SbcCD ATPase subunit